MSVVLRPAAPTAAEGERFAEYFDIAAAGVMRQLFGRRSREVLTEAFLSTGHDFSFETVVFAEVDGEIVGMSSAYDAAYHGASTMRPMLRAAGLSAIRAAAVSLFAWRLFAFLDDVRDGDYYLAALAVDGSRRGEGIGTVLPGYDRRSRIPVGAVQARRPRLPDGEDVLSGWARTQPT